MNFLNRILSTYAFNSAVYNISHKCCQRFFLIFVRLLGRKKVFHIICFRYNKIVHTFIEQFPLNMTPDLMRTAGDWMSPSIRPGG